MAAEFPIFEVLKRHGVPFVIVGGHAVNFHGFTRATEDTDVIWIRSPEAEAALESALTEMEAVYIGKEIDPATGIERTYPVSINFIRSHHLMMLCTKFGFFDLFTYVPGHPQLDVMELYNSSLLAGEYRYCSLQWLRRMKSAAGRGKDQIDLEQLPMDYE